MENSKTIYLGLLALFIGAALLGSSAIFVRFSETSPSLTAFYRALLALPFLAIWIIATNKKTQLHSSLNKKDLLILLYAGAFFGTDMAIWNWSIKFTSVAHATLMANTAPIFVTIISYFYLRNHIESSFLKALFLTFSGVCIVIFFGSGSDTSRLLGDSLGLIAALFYASYILCIKRLTNTISPSLTLFYATLFTAIFLLPVGYIEADSFFPETREGWIVLFSYAAISQALAQGLITYGISKLSAHFSSLVLLIQPVAAAIYGWLILFEGINLFQIVGGAIVLFGIYMSSRDQT